MPSFVLGCRRAPIATDRPLVLKPQDRALSPIGLGVLLREAVHFECCRKGLRLCSIAPKIGGWPK